MASTERTQPIHGEMITLGQLIKVLNLVSSGAEVKEFLAREQVRVNGQIDNRRGRKLFHGDVIEFEDSAAIRLVPQRF